MDVEGGVGLAHRAAVAVLLGMRSVASRPTHPLSYATMLWALAFAAPHAWWALGLSAGFPGGEASYVRFMSSDWRYAYDVVVFAASLLGARVAWTLGRPRVEAERSFRRARALARTAAVALGLRGVAGMIVDGRADPVWWPMFLLGAVLFGALALVSSRPTQS